MSNQTNSDQEKDTPAKPASSPGWKPEDEPLPYDSLDFAAAWMAWCRHRSEIRKRLTPTSVRESLRKLGGIGEARATAMIRHTIANGWQGLREPEIGRTNQRPVTEAERAAAWGVPMEGGNG